MDYYSGTVQASITEKAKGWYLVEMSVYLPGVGYCPEYYAARPINERAAFNLEFDGLELLFSLNNPEELDNPSEERNLTNYAEYLSPSKLLIVTRPHEFRSEDITLNLQPTIK